MNRPAPARRSRSRRARTPRLSPQPLPGSLPASLTFFVTAAERRAVLDRLRTINPDRAAALLITLGIHQPGDST